jgi:hypothetical protein
VISGTVSVVIVSPSEGDLELEDFALVHQPVAVRHLVECPGAFEDASRLDPPFQHVREQFVDVGADRGGAAGDAGVLPEGDAVGSR